MPAARQDDRLRILAADPGFGPFWRKDRRTIAKLPERTLDERRKLRTELYDKDSRIFHNIADDCCFGLLKDNGTYIPSSSAESTTKGTDCKRFG